MNIQVIKNRENPFVQVDKFAINDSRLSWKAKGILVYLLSKPDKWRINSNDLYKRSIDGYDSLKSGLNELALTGYMETFSVSKDNGSEFNGRVISIFEKPLFAYGYRDPKNRSKRYTEDEKLLPDCPYSRKHSPQSRVSPKQGLPKVG